MSTPERLQRQPMMSLPQQTQQGGEDSRALHSSTPAFFALDPNNAAKQMAALNATSQHRRTSQSGGTSDSLFGSRQPAVDSASDPVVSAPQPTNRGPGATAQVLKSRRDEFLKFVAGVMNARHTPLPSTITGIPSAYDPTTSRWKSIEPMAEPGGFRLAGCDVDLFKLWQLVLSHGGHAKLTRESSWSAVLSHFGLPEVLPEPQANGNVPVARILAQYYIALLAPFEEVYLRNMHQQQQKALQARQQQQQQQGYGLPPNHHGIDPSSVAPHSQTSQNSGQGLSVSTTLATPSLAPQPKSDISQPSNTGSIEPTPSHTSEMTMVSQQRPATSSTAHTPQSTELAPSLTDGATRDRADGAGTPAFDQGDGPDGEDDARKRKFHEEEMGKRARQRIDNPETGQQNDVAIDQHPASSQVDQSQTAGQGQLASPTRPSTANVPQPTRQPRLRRKIEYVPLARDVDTYGGRDLDLIDTELAKATSRRPQRLVDEWGVVDIDGLTMSLRSRLPTELSYALTLLSVLSTMRGPSPDAGFSLQQCDDLLDELLDLLREHAFEDADDVSDEAETFWTHRELVGFVRDHELQTFSDQPRTKGLAPPGGGPKPSPADIVSAILNLFRNFSLTSENQRFMGQHPDVLSLLLRICSLSVRSDAVKRHPPSPSSAALSLSEVVKTRRDVLTIVSNLMPFTNLALHPPRVCTSLFELLASFLVEPHELSSPSGVVIQSGASNAGAVRPPLVIDLALEAFSKLAQPDTNRLTLSRGIRLPWLWSLFNSLVHRLPVSTEDFAITMRMHDTWLSYIEKVVLSIYSICFLASPELKMKIRTDRTLAFPRLILRMVKRFVSINHPDARQYFLVSSRRAVEALKLIDEGSDAFECPQSSGPVFAFGMGFGESDAKQAETGIGMLAGFQDDVTWSIMMMPHLDDVMFAELDSLSRLGV